MLCYVILRFIVYLFFKKFFMLIVYSALRHDQRHAAPLFYARSAQRCAVRAQRSARGGTACACAMMPAPCAPRAHTDAPDYIIGICLCCLRRHY